MRAKLALMLHLGGVGECGRLIWVWSVQAQESGDLQLCDMDAMIMLIDSMKTKDWPNGLAWKLIEKLCIKFKPGDMIASAEQLEKLTKLTLKKGQDPEYLKRKIASLKTSYGC
jgi:hypothetical protein